MVNEQNKTFVEELNINRNSNDKYDDNPYIYCVGESEIDGIRIMTQNEILLIRKIPDYIKSIFNIFGD